MPPKKDEPEVPETPEETEVAPLLPENLSELDERDLAKLERGLRSDYTKGRKASIPDIEHLGLIADALDAIKADRDRRTTERMEAEAKLTELDQRVTEPEVDETNGGHDEPDEPPTPKKEEKVPASSIPAIAASAKPVLVPPITSVKAPDHGKPDLKPSRKVVITAAADVPDFRPGAEIPTYREFAHAMGERHRAFAGAPLADGTQDLVPVAKVHYDFPPERQLVRDPESDWAKIRAVQTQVREARNAKEPLAAAAGACGMPDVYYDFWTAGVTDRPIRDGLTAYQATRGGLTYQPPPNMTTLGGAITRLTRTQMGAGTTKNVYEVTCPSAVTVDVIGQSRIFRFTNWTDRFNPELRELIVEQGMVLGARTADQALRDQIIAGSTAITSPAAYGAARTMLSALDTAVAGARSRWRIGSEVAMRCIIDDWVKPLIRADLARSQGIGTDLFSVNDSMIEGWFRDRGVNPIFALDFSSSPPGSQTFSTSSSAGHLRDFPDHIQWQLFPEGTWLLLDGGELNLGMVRDSTRNASNTFDIFDEHFEAAAFIGVESLTITTALCADGTYAPAGDAISCVNS